MVGLKLRVIPRLPASFTATGGFSVKKENGIWTLSPDFSQLVALTPGALTNPTLKEVWIYDPTLNQYNVLTLAGLGDALYKATSTTSLAVGTGSKVFTTQSGKDIGVGSFVLATSDADPTNYMLGQVTAYIATTLTINVSVAGVGGTGTHTDWTLRASSPPGAQGIQGASYAATSTSSQTVGNSGTKTFTTQAGLAYTAGARVRTSDSSAPATNWMEGVVTSYSGTTLVFTADKSAGSGTLTSWNINIAGQPGAGDLTSTNNLSDLAAKYTGFDNLSIHGADIASATTTNLETATGNLVDVTGTTAITAITLSEGHTRTVRFTGILTLTNGASLVLPGGANITTAAGDFADFRGYAAGVVRCTEYIRASGKPIVNPTPTELSLLIGTNVQAFDAQLFSNIPQNSQSTAYGFVLTDGQKEIFHPAADTTARTWTIPANSSVAYPVGTVIALTGEALSGVITLVITTDTLVWVPSGTTGSRTLTAPFAGAIKKITSTKWQLVGAGIT